MDAKSADCVGAGTPHYTLNEASKRLSEARDSGTYILGRKHSMRVPVLSDSSKNENMNPILVSSYLT